MNTDTLNLLTAGINALTLGNVLMIAVGGLLIFLAVSPMDFQSLGSACCMKSWHSMLLGDTCG